jgi:predicted DNA-binding WGR domain protein
MAFLTRIDPSRNCNRFYLVEIMPTLFGEFALLREWGRRGSAGTVRLTSYERRGDGRDGRAAHDQTAPAARLYFSRRHLRLRRGSDREFAGACYSSAESRTRPKTPQFSEFSQPL